LLQILLRLQELLNLLLQYLITLLTIEYLHIDVTHELFSTVEKSTLDLFLVLLWGEGGVKLRVMQLFGRQAGHDTLSGISTA
jgi:hypothetical protein